MAKDPKVITGDDEDTNDFVRNANNARASRQSDERAMEDRAVSEDRVLSDEDRVAALRNEFLYSALPAVPQRAGWHFIFLSTNNQYDTIQRRVRMGYVPVKFEELAADYGELIAYKQNSGQFEGLILCNEMLLCKIPQSTYNAYMKELHHTQPNEQADKLRSAVERLKSGDLDDGRKLVREVGNGTDELLRRPAPPPSAGW